MEGAQGHTAVKAVCGEGLETGPCERQRVARVEGDGTTAGGRRCNRVFSIRVPCGHRLRGPASPL